MNKTADSQFPFSNLEDSSIWAANILPRDGSLGSSLMVLLFLHFYLIYNYNYRWMKL